MFTSMCDVSLLRFINFCQIKRRTPSPVQTTEMCNANTNAIRKALLAEPAHRPEVVSAQTGNCWHKTDHLRKGSSARRGNVLFPEG